MGPQEFDKTLQNDKWVCIPANTSTIYQSFYCSHGGGENNSWLLLADDASMGEINNGYSNPCGDTPTYFEQAIFNQYMACLKLAIAMNETPLEDTQESFLGLLECFGLKQPDETNFHPLNFKHSLKLQEPLTKHS
jgi:hypothetical protein